jgi:hypothetical protein
VTGCSASYVIARLVRPTGDGVRKPFLTFHVALPKKVVHVQLHCGKVSTKRLIISGIGQPRKSSSFAKELLDVKITLQLLLLLLQKKKYKKRPLLKQFTVHYTNNH